MTPRKRKAKQRGAVARPINLDREAKVIRRELKSLEVIFRRTVKCADSLGGRLARCKEAVQADGRGDWMKWLEEKRIPYHSAHRLIKLHEKLHELARNDPAKFSKLQNSDLPVSAIYTYLEQPPEVTEETARKLESGELIEKPQTTIERKPPVQPETTSTRQISLAEPVTSATKEPPISGPIEKSGLSGPIEKSGLSGPIEKSGPSEPSERGWGGSGLFSLAVADAVVANADRCR